MREAIKDLVEYAGLAAVVAGVYILAGAGWALVTFGVLAVAASAVMELRS